MINIYNFRNFFNDYISTNVDNKLHSKITIYSMKKLAVQNTNLLVTTGVTLQNQYKQVAMILLSLLFYKYLSI